MEVKMVEKAYSHVWILDNKVKNKDLQTLFWT